MTTDCLAQPAPRQFHSEEAVSLPGVPVRPQTAFVRRVMSDSLRIDYCGLRGAFVNGATALEIDANFEALRMKTAGPIERSPALKIVPFNAHAIARKASKKLTPFPFDFSPDRFLTDIIPFQHDDPNIEI